MRIVDKTIDGKTVAVKVPENWTIRVLAKKPGETKRKICIFHGDNQSGQSTEVVRIFDRHALTASGSVYELKRENVLATMWPLQLQIKYPEVYQRLVDLKIF